MGDKGKKDKDKAQRQKVVKQGEKTQVQAKAPVKLPSQKAR